ncbi:PREDICTED: uncharacterized protein LOC109227602 [Nicotiana attenuata]|uniref:uncharacterized protein LOC109227602 n=1 Tax=Nicotiana attenuata TaxID=49451 RepID=UPI0009058031|nr:PREDICTED: uncharacterized protein LOC109227602 [Nicotiana attenuata]
MKERNQRKQILELTSIAGNMLNDSEAIKEEIVAFYKSLMGSAADSLPAIDKLVMQKGPNLTQQQIISLCKDVTEEEIYEGLCSIGEDKTHGVDGSKILASRMQGVITIVISEAQAGFAPVRKIVDNIILAHELVKAYSRKKIPPRCMIKIDLQKAYNSVE